MSDKERMSTQNLVTRGYNHAILTLLVMIACTLTMSKCILAEADSVPYDPSDKEHIPAAAARLCNLRCSRVASGCSYTFDVEVFETCWKPIYAIEIECSMDAVVEPLSWPDSWKAETVPSKSTSGASTVFYTSDKPIAPGAVLSGFGLVSYSGGMVIRWFPADEEGVLVGKVSRLDLACPMSNESSSWGSIKAIYR